MASTESPRTACVVCRFRKVRCDRTAPACLCCVRLGVPCPGFDEATESLTGAEVARSAQAIFDSSGVEKRRFGSCDECRVTKNRCSRSRPSCKRCTKRDLRCTYGALKAPAPSLRGTAIVGASESPLLLDPAMQQHQQPGPLPSARFNAGPNTALLGHDMAYADNLLSSEKIPDDKALVFRLITAYFERIQPVRACSFIHKPSFLRALGRGTVDDEFGRPLFQVMCALGARILYMDSRFSGEADNRPLAAMPGHQWAEAARREITPEMHIPTTQKIMSTILLCEYALRTDQNALAMMLSTCAFRAIQLLGHSTLAASSSTPQSPCPPALAQETWHRLVWASYTLDVFLASGVDLNSSWQSKTPAVPLPCSHRDFLAETPAPSPRLVAAAEAEDPTLAGRLGLPALLILLTRLRASVLRLIRCPRPGGLNIWDASSSFVRLLAQLDAINDHMPDEYRISDHNMFVQRDEHILGAVFSLHFLYQAVAFDLTRISLPGFTFPLAAALADAPADFRSQCQRRCIFHATQLSDLARKGMAHAPTAFDDPICTEIILEATKIIIIHCATVPSDDQTPVEARASVRSNLEALATLHPNRPGENPHVLYVLALCSQFGFSDISGEWRSHASADGPDSSRVEITGSADVQHLVRFAPFRRAIYQLQARDRERRAAETDTAILQSTASASQGPRPPVVMSATGPSSTAEQQQQTPGAATLGFPPSLPSMDAGAFGQDGQAGLSTLGFGAVDGASAEDYVRTADLLSGYITWDVADFSLLSTTQDFEWMDELGA